LGQAENINPARLLAKRRKGIWAAAEPHPDALGLAEVAKQHAALLALVSQATALSASERVAGEVQHCHPPAAIFAVDVGGANKPWALPAKMAGGPLIYLGADALMGFIFS
jgi:hypothetical protein